MFLLVWAADRVFLENIVVRFPKADPSASTYSQELRELSGHFADAGAYAASEDGRYLAFNTAAAQAFHTVCVWDSWTQTVTRVVSIQEMDPGSGMSHAFAWSSSPRALLIFGSGKLPFRKAGDLCLVYLPTQNRLQAVSPCP